MPSATRLSTMGAMLIGRLAAHVASQRLLPEQIHDPLIQLRRNQLDGRPLPHKRHRDHQHKREVAEKNVDRMVQPNAV